MEPQCLGTIVPWQTETLLLGADHAALVLKHTQWRSNYSLLTSDLRFSKASNMVRLGWGFLFRPQEYRQHLLKIHFPNASSLIVSRGVLAGFFCFVTTGKKVTIMTITNICTLWVLEMLRKNKVVCKSSCPRWLKIK